VLRGFYALEQNNLVFWIQCVVAATNIGVALLLVREVDALDTAPALVLAYGAAYAVGASLSYALLARRVGGLDTAKLLRFLVRLAIATGLATAATAAAAYGLHLVVGSDSLPAALVSTLGAGLVGGIVLLVLARMMRVEELTSMVDTITRRLPLPRRH